MDRYKYTIESKEEISDHDSNIIWEYLKVILDQIGMLISRKEKMCQPKSLQSQIPQEQLREHLTVDMKS